MPTEKAPEQKNKATYDSDKIRLQELQLEAQKENIEQIESEISTKSTSEERSELEKEKKETENKINFLKKELEAEYRQKKIEDALQNNPETVGEYRSAIVENKSTKNQIEKNKSELGEIEEKIDKIKKILTTPSKVGPAVFMNPKELDSLLARKDKLQKEQNKLEENASNLETKIKEIENKILG